MTDMSQMSCRDFVEALSSKQPTPGGGGAAALSAAMGMALANMVAEYTIGKEAYAEVEAEVKDLLTQGRELQAKLLEQIQADADAYQQLRQAYAAPRETEEQKTERVQILSDASKTACRPPIDVTKLALKGLRICKRLAEIGCVSVISDVACGASMLQAAMRASYQNIMVNMKNVLDFDFMDAYKHFSMHSIGEGDLICKVVDTKINQRA